MSKRARAEVSAAVPPPTQNVASGLAVQSTANGQGPDTSSSSSSSGVPAADATAAAAAAGKVVMVNGRAVPVSQLTADAGTDEFHDLSRLQTWAPPLWGTVAHLNHCWGFIQVDGTELCFHLNDLHGLRRQAAEGDRVSFRRRPERPDVAFDVTPEPPFPTDPEEVRNFCDELRKARPIPAPMLLYLAGNIVAFERLLAWLPDTPATAEREAVLVVHALILFFGAKTQLDNGLHRELFGHMLQSLVRGGVDGGPSFLVRATAHLHGMDHAKEPLKSAALVDASWRILQYWKTLCELADEVRVQVDRFKLILTTIARINGFKLSAFQEPRAPLQAFPSCDDLRLGPDDPRSGLNPQSGLRKIRPKGPYQDANDYIRTQFELLKADSFTQFARIVAQEFFGVQCPLESERVAPCTYYTHVELVGEATMPHLQGFCHILQFRPPDWEEEGKEKKLQDRLTSGMLVAITTDKFRHELWWATIQVRHPDMVRAGLVGVKFLHGKPRNFAKCARRNQFAKRAADCIMVEADFFFYNCRAVLQSLERLHQRQEVPLKDVLVDVKRTQTVPSYRFLRDGYEYVNLLDVMSSQTRFDPTQEDAFRALATNKVLLVQGPPGTGKSFIGSKLAEAVTRLRRDKRKVSPLPFRPILVIAFKNRSLDEFLCDCLPFTNEVVRVGGQSKATQLAPYNLRAKTPSTKEGRVMRFRAADKAAQLVQLAGRIRKLSLTPELLEELLTPEQKPYWGEITPESITAWFPGCPFLYAALDALPPFQGTPTASPAEADEEGDELSRLDASEQTKELRERRMDERAKETLRLSAVPLNGTGLYAKATMIPKLQKLDVVQRQLVAQAWLCTKHADLFREYTRLRFQFEALTLAGRVARDEAQLAVLQSADVVGMTTTGCATNQDLTQQLQPSVIIVEEAAEVLEAQLLCCLTGGVHQVILIGDHLQLQPSVEIRALADQCNLGLSLFERLCNNEFAPFMLETQRRMSPEIASLVSPIYGGLKTSAIVYQRSLATQYGPRKDVPGMGATVFFWTHEVAEEGYKGSQFNPQEVTMAMDLTAYLLKQGLAPGQITAVTPYAGQLRALKSAAVERGLGIDVQTVDSFQGGENDIIVLSLVRTQRLTDFLQRQNRMCVALSRARFGLFILGSPGILRTPECAHWERTVDILDAFTPSAVGPELPLRCRLHPTETAVATTTEPFPHDFCPHCRPDGA